MNIDWIGRAREQLAAFDTQALRDTGILPGDGRQFFPVIGYPPLTMFTPMDEGPMFADLDKRPSFPISAYLHIPFCPTRCTYCHWITRTGSKEDEVDVYIGYLDKEMRLYKEKLGYDAIPIHSVLWGGGTPTYPSASQLARLMESFHRHFDLSSCTQFSVEAEPGTLLGPEGRERLKVLRDYGVDRISLGVQSMDDQVLKKMARSHSHADTLKSIDNMRAAGIENIFIDLIYGYPGQTVEHWLNNMLQAVAMDIDGYQLYRLRIRQHGDREGSIVRQYNNDPDRFHDTDEVWLMKMLGILISEEHGFGEHQRRVFARSPEVISHYLRDWCCHLHDVVGVGVSSWSNVRGVFSQNVGDHNLASYYSLVDSGRVSIDRGKVRTVDDNIRRSFILPLKNSWLDKNNYTNMTGIRVQDYFADEIAWLKDYDLIDEDDSVIRLTRKGSFFADEVATQFFHPDFLPFQEVTRISEISTLHA